MRITNFTEATKEYSVFYLTCTCEDRTIGATEELDVVQHRVVGWFFDEEHEIALPGIMRDHGIVPQKLFRNVRDDNCAMSIVCEQSAEVSDVFIAMEHAILHGLNEHYDREVERERATRKNVRG